MTTTTTTTATTTTTTTTTTIITGWFTMFGAVKNTATVRVHPVHF